MERQGRVRQLYQDGTALVIFTGECALECHQCEGCQRETEGVIARNPEGARLGELVLVRSRPQQLLLTVLMLLVLPVGGLFAGYVIGSVLWDAGKLTGCIALAVGIGIAAIYDRYAASRPGSGYTLIKYPQNINKGDNGFD